MGRHYLSDRIVTVEECGRPRLSLEGDLRYWPYADVCVPISCLPDALREARRTIESHGLEGAILGHVGDGNYHAVFPVNPVDEAELKTAEKVNSEIVAYALARGGTCTGEHGVGCGKMEHLQKEHGDSLQFMREIKRLADPKGTMNPGKIFSSPERQVPEDRYPTRS